MAVDSGARPSNTLSGDLASRPLAMLLAGACERGTSGTFTFRHGDRRALLTMRGGQIAVVRTSPPVAFLGGILYELGAIDIETLNATLHEVASAKRLHGEVLLERGAITRTKLDEALAEQTLRNVHQLFSLPEATTWTFRDDVDDLAGARDEPRPAIETWPAIWRGLREQPPTPHARRTVAKIDGGLHLKDLQLVRRFALAPEEMALCERLHAQPATVAHLVSTSRLAPDRTTTLVYLLVLARCVSRVETEPMRPADLGVAGIRERAQRIDREDPYTTLGLRAGAPREAARAAYFRLARLWHPDKIPAELKEVRAECEHVFVRLGDAHRLITDIGARMTIDDVIGAVNDVAANDSVAPPAPPRTTLRDADAALARGDLATAEEIARSLTSAGADGPGARAISAWCGIGAGANTDPIALEQAMAALDRVLTGDPDCVRALYFRGQVLKRLGKIDAAIRDFRKATRLDPRHIDDEREVRIYEMRRRTGTSDPNGAGPPSTRSPSSSRNPGSTKTPSTTGQPVIKAANEDDSVRSGLRRLLAKVVREGT